ncbi:restriction endonuclease subunit S [Rhodococcus antarcticus]|uniref:Restriction endonuclease subunit S n=1 Tax=Rhodococcus antarcticus TaxID=2987751 RepID=A0ABY6NYQ4_9NOCA|nr:restriction endonuclease subunit S [Rhodococcus antarcticus]UZJ24517.1 restriction endonuclease subunit S [Rhodococcus antarcticus]
MIYSRLPIRRLGSVFLGKMIQPELKSIGDVRAPYLRAAHVQPLGRLIDVDDKTMWFDPQELRLHDLRDGDVVIVEGGAGYGRSAVITGDHDGWGFQNSIIRVRPRHNRADGRFVNYALQSALALRQIEVACFISTIPHFTADKVGAFSIPAPPLPAQSAIAEYLDRETAKIDALISKQRRLIATLRERRAAVVGRAIGPETGGLRSLGGLSVGGIASGVDFSADEGQVGWPRYIRTTDVSGMASLHIHTLRRITVEQAGDSLVRRNDILFTRSGSLGTNYLHESDEVMAFAGYMVRFRTRTDLCVPRYVAWWSQSRHHQDQIALGASRSTIDNFSGSKFRTMKIPLPPLTEQRRIADHLDEQTAKIDTLIAKAERFIEVSQERRSALITAAVTGQIDVRKHEGSAGALSSSKTPADWEAQYA